MSPIVGVWSINGDVAVSRAIEPMITSLSQLDSGPQGRWTGECVALGQCVQDTIDQRSVSGMPTEIPMVLLSDPFALVGDCRLDNRAELIRLLGLPLTTDLDDRALVLRAYRRWGVGFAERLIGDFALAVWDGRTKTLVCARDATGVRQLYYYHQMGERFVFASALRGVLAAPRVPHVLEERRLADFIASRHEDHQLTFYRGILRLPPAHVMQVSERGLKLTQYWRLDPGRELRLASDAQYVEAFRETFTNAVTARLRAPRPIGSMLSGGLDSSSIVCVARELLEQTEGPLHTFSATFEPGAGHDERAFIAAVVRQGGLVPHEVPSAQLTPFSHWELVLKAHEEPPWGPNVYLPWAIYRAAAGWGVRVLLSGFDGDSAVSHGLLRLAELAARRRWGTLASELALYSWRSRQAPWSVARRYAFGPLAPAPIRQAWHQWRGHYGQSDFKRRLLRPEFRRRMGLDRSSRAQPPATGIPRLRAAQHRQLTSSLRDRTLELSARSAAAFGVEPRYPFEDRRLLEFCLSLPSDQRLRRGWSRSIARRAFSDWLPQEVARRTDKADFTSQLVQGMQRDEAAHIAGILDNAGDVLGTWLDVDCVQQLHRRCMARAHSDEHASLFRLVSLVKWLQNTSIALG